MFAGKTAPELQRAEIGVDQFFLAPELFGKQSVELAAIDIQQHRQRSDIHNVFEQLPLPYIGVDGIADLGQRHADDVDVLPQA